MNRTRTLFPTLLLPLLLGAAGCASPVSPDALADRRPRIFPDYADVTFPVNIAPPNFRIEEEGEEYLVEAGRPGDAEPAIRLRTRRPRAVLPEGRWRKLLREAAGGAVYFRVSVRSGERWTRYADIADSVSATPVDPVLVYRLLYPGYELWNEMGVYQRELGTYRQTAVVENRDIGGQCVNCHAFRANSPDTLMLHVRGRQGGTLVSLGGRTEKVNPQPEGFAHGATYPAWHPGGRYLAFSGNEIQQFFHAAGTKPIEVSDLGADLMIYDTERRETFTDSLVCGPAHMETFPAWSPDGGTLYFCRAPGYREGMALDSIRYDLWRVRFDADGGRLHDAECVYAASAEGRSASFPRVSPDGRYLLFTRSAYGNFSVWHPESDLCLLRLADGSVRELTEVNSPDADSYHSWASSGRWFVFSSKRVDGLWAHPHLAAFDPRTGRAAKPFVLPQRDPDFYGTFMYTFNVPELVTAPVRAGDALRKAVAAPARRASAR